MTRRVKAIGRSVVLGNLYDSRMEQNFSTSLFKRNLPDELIISQDFPNTLYEFCSSSTSKFDKLDIKGDLKLSVISGLANLEGSGKYLKSDDKNTSTVECSLIYSIKTKTESFNISDIRFIQLDLISKESLENESATHAICGITWGNNVICSFEQQIEKESQRKQVQDKLNSEISKLCKILAIEGKVQFDLKGIDKSLLDKTKIKILDDLSKRDFLPQTLEETLDFMRNLPNEIKETNNGKGVPIEFELIPLIEVNHYTFKDTNLKIVKRIKSIDDAIADTIETELDQLMLVKNELDDRIRAMKKKINSFKFLTDIYNQIIDIKQDLENAELILKMRIRALILDIRRGEIEYGDNELLSLIQKYRKSKWSATEIKKYLAALNRSIDPSIVTWVKYIFGWLD